MKRKIRCVDLPSLCLGAAVLGSGGGGDTAILSSFVTEILNHAGSVDLISVADLMPDDLVIPVAYVGSPAASLALGPTKALFVKPIEAIQAANPGRRLIIMPAEIGGCNALTPLIAASCLGLPVLDADLIGRAFPYVSMCKPAVNFPVKQQSFYMANRDGELMQASVENALAVESKARAFTVESRGSASIATYLFNGCDYAAMVIEGSITRAFGIGDALLSQNEASVAGGVIKASGVVTALQRVNEGGFLIGSFSLKTKDAFIRVAFQNEYLCASMGGEPIVQTPDIITLFDAHTHAPIASESLCVNQALDLVVFPAPPFWRGPAALCKVSLNQFGHLFDIVNDRTYNRT